MRKLVFLILPALVFIFLSTGSDAARGRYYRQKKVVEQQKVSEEKVSEIDLRFKKIYSQLNYLLRKNVDIKQPSDELKLIETEFDSIKKNYTGKDIDLSVKKIESDINSVEIKIKNMTEIAQRLDLLYMLMAAFGLVLITGIAIYFTRMYLKRRT